MLELDLIQTRGFHNIRKNGKITGFQFNVRLTYYRGIFLSQLRPKKVTVDGEVYENDQVIWSLNGTDYTCEEMEKRGDVHWNPLDVMTIKIEKEGGLPAGYHEISAAYMYSSSYMPPKLQAGIDGDEISPFMEMMFGQLHSTRKLLLVQ